MKAVYFWIIFIVLIGSFISFYLIPSGEEVALINLKSQRYTKAEQFYLDQYEKGIRTPSIIYELSVLFERQGELDKAIHIMKDYSQEHPEDMDVLKRLSELYLLNNQYEDYDQTLIKMHHHKAKLELDTLRELKDFYAEQGDIKQREAILKKIINSGKADENDYAELATIYAQEKQFDQAASILQTRRSYFAEKNTIDMVLYEVWVDSHLGKVQKENAVHLVADYLKKKNDPKLTLYVLNVFKESYPDLAIQLVDQLQSGIENNTYVEAAVLSILWDHPEQKEKIHQQVIKLEARAKTNPTLQNFIFDVYIDREDEEHLRRLIRTTPAQKIDERRIIDLAILASYQDKPVLAWEMQQALGPKYLEEHPIMALALAIGTQQKDTRESLNRYLKTHSLTRTARFNLFRLAAAAKFDHEALEMGKDLPPFTGMQENELLEIAQTYAQMKKADLLYPILVASLPTVGSKNAGAALALLDIALHRPQAAVDWMEKQQMIKKDTLKAFFETAKENKEYALDLYIAQRLYRDYPSFYSESSYGLALVQMGQVKNGMPLLKKVYSEHPLNPQIQKDYLAALILAVKQDQIYKQDLLVFMQDRERQGHISINLLRDFGYIYLDTLHDFHRAQAIFFIIANSESPTSDDTQTLIYLWGPKVTEEQGQWIIRRAELSSIHDLAYWLENLNFIGYFKSTIRIFQKRADCILCAKAYFAYMQALAYEKLNCELKRTIDIVFPMLTERKQLEELSAYSEIAEYNEARVCIWQKIIGDYSADPLVWQALGRALFDVRAFCMARTALEMFFYLNQSSSNVKLYESFYEYAEVLRKQRHFLASRLYYNFALSEIASAEEQTLLMKEIAAQSYYQLNYIEKGLCKIREYYEKSGKDSDSTAAYTNMLMDDGRLRPAQRLIDRLFGK